MGDDLRQYANHALLGALLFRCVYRHERTIEEPHYGRFCNSAQLVNLAGAVVMPTSTELAIANYVAGAQLTRCRHV